MVVGARSVAWQGGGMTEDIIRQLSSRLVYRDQWMSLRVDEIERPDGSLGAYSVVDKRDFALIIPAENDGFHLVEEYRYPVGGRYWSFPQGGFAAGHDGTPADLARAELAEETGLTAGRLDHLGRLFGAHGTSSQGYDVFLATELTQGPPSREHEEQDMRHSWIPRAGFEAMIRDGQIKDDSTLAAYALLLLYERD
jgi:8-oxo-dGTP pyrophosphatase MutT (NUDIX family)